MSYAFDLSPQEKRQQLQALTQDWSGENDFGASAGAGILKGAGMGIERGVVKTVGALANVATGVNAAIGAIDDDERDARFRATDEFIGNAVDYWTPKTTEVGKVGQTLGALGEMVMPLVVGKGNASLLAMTQAMNTGTDLIKKGVDANTAATVGTVEAGATMLGAWLPVLGKTVAGRATGNALANTAVNAGMVGAEGAILKGAGYNEQAQAFDPFDMQARAVDLMLGAAFGALTRGQQLDLPGAVFGAKGAKRVQDFADGLVGTLGNAMKPSDMDAAFSAANIKHMQIDSAAGRPVDGDSWRAHSNAMETSLRQLTEGQPIDVASTIDGAQFRVKPQTDYQGSIDDVLAYSDDLDAPSNVRADQPVIANAVDANIADIKAPGAPDTAVKPSADQLDADAEIAALQQHIQQHGDFDVSLAAGDDGDGRITRPASQLLDEADAAVKEADTMGKGILAAARCFMGFGQ